MLRSEVSKNFGGNIETIRFYENEGLISKPKRLDNGYRSYSRENLIELKFIQHCRSLGLSIEEVRILKDLQVQSNDCHQAKEIVDKNLGLIDQKISDLKNLKKQLQALSNSCHETSAAKDCGIVKTLTKASEGEDCLCHTPTATKKAKRLV
jgi:DNA-binding transcriptional MerR regulator